MTSRQRILDNIALARHDAEHPLPKVPLFDDKAATTDLVSQFTQAVINMGGEVAALEGQSLAELVDKKTKDAKIICSHVEEIKGNFPLTLDTQPTDLKDVDFGIVRASFAVAETGSLCLTDSNFGINTLGYLPQHLIVLVDPADILFNLHNAYQRPEWREHGYAVFHTGPSATADIEGILIHGAQGVRSLLVILQPRQA
ncbi:MAG: LUD domain-containing protein [Zymomonas mobilis]|uniref:LutC/YkgG family protein n=1 Tax=Zymomonas mobilis TaxID=542 RepID=UPI0039EBA1E8